MDVSGIEENANQVDDSESDDELPVKLHRNKYTMDVLQSWYDTKFSSKPNGSRPQLTIIMPNFEEFKPTIIKDLIKILRFVLKSMILLIIYKAEM